MTRRAMLAAVLLALMMVGSSFVTAQDEDPAAIFDTPFVMAAWGANASTWSLIQIDLRLQAPLLLTDDSHDDIAPNVSSNGRYVLFQRGDTQTQGSFTYYLLDRKCWPDCEPTPLPAQVNTLRDLRWSPVGSRLIAWGLENAVWIFDVEASTLQQVIGGTWNAYPAWSPDGKWIVLSSDDVPSGGALSDDIQVIPAQAEVPDSERINLTYSGLFIEETHPTFSPDGTWIAYTTRNIETPEAGDSIDQEQAALIVMDAACVDLPDTCLDSRRMLSEPGQLVGEYVWSPDAGSIAYIEGEPFGLGEGLGTIWLVDIASGETRQLTENAEYRGLAWSPNSLILLFEHATDLSLDVEFMPVDGETAPQTFISGFRASAMPYWTPLH